VPHRHTPSMLEHDGGSPGHGAPSFVDHRVPGHAPSFVDHRVPTPSSERGFPEGEGPERRARRPAESETERRLPESQAERRPPVSQAERRPLELQEERRLPESQAERRPPEPRAERLPESQIERRPPDSQIERRPSDTRRSIPFPGERDSLYSEEEIPEATRRPSTIIRIPPPRSPGPGDLGRDDEQREHQEHLAHTQQRLAEVAQDAEEAEDRREQHFRDGEEERSRLFREHEARRDEAAGQRRDELMQELERRLAEAFPQLEVPADVLPSKGEPIIPGDTASMAESLRSAAQDAATRHAEDIMDIVKGEREEIAKERDMARTEWERLLAQSEAERNAVNDEKDARIRALENELASVRSDVENERQQRVTEEAERKERERAESLEREEGLRNQLTDITNLLQDQREDCIRKRETSDERWREQQERNEHKDALCQEIRDMVARMLEDREADRIRDEEERLATESKPGLFILVL
jgi:hypothetical protein